MIFTPYADESKVINDVNSIRNSEYAIIRMTSTMINKNNTDCNGFFRRMLKKIDVVDYDNLKHGKNAGVFKECLFIHGNNITRLKMNFYNSCIILFTIFNVIFFIINFILNFN